MSKIFIVEDCTKCPNFIPCTDPRDFRVSCKKLGCLGSPLIFIGGGFPIDCPLNDYAEPKTGYWISWYEVIEEEWGTEHDPHCKCSECNTEVDPHTSKFINCCPVCGAKMVGYKKREEA